MFQTKIRYPFFVILFFTYTVFAQQGNFIERTDTFKVSFENKYELSAINIIPLSLRIFIGNRGIAQNDYQFDFKTNSFSLSDSLNYSLFDTIYATYKSIPLSLKKEYKHRSIVKVYDKILGYSVNTAKNESVDLSNKAIFGSKLKSNGTLLRGFTIGTNKDMTINSGLRLQLSGKLSDDITVVAALTDENTPIQPEGNTERLEELDKVFIQVKHKIGNATFGDYELHTNIGEFGRFNKKLQGVIGNLKFDNYGGSVAVAGARGKFNTMRFNGIDGVQGPYRLHGVNNENDIIIIAGSEKVFLDGKKLKRGENNDYTIEYSNAEITFTPKVLLTSLSRLTIDFEYTTRKYERNIIGGNAYANILDNKLKLKVNIFQEGDNKKNPIDFLLTDEDKKILENSGDEIFAASRSGVELVKPDDNGKIRGIYSKRDTVIDNDTVTIYIYEPNSPSAVYSVSFSYVGEGNGDYKRESLGNFIFVGIKKGSYLPIRLLPLPENIQLANVLLEYDPVENIKLNLEIAGSNRDKNIFSPLDDNDNLGFARNIKLNVQPVNITIAKTNYGKLSAFFRNRFIDENFKSIDRINEVEFKRNYNIENIKGTEENLTEAQLEYLPVDNISLRTKYGLLTKGKLFNSNRYLTEFNITNLNNLNLNYEYDYVGTENKSLSSYWVRQKGEARYKIWKVSPGFMYRAENKREYNSFADSLLLTSKKYYEYSPFLRFDISKKFNFAAKYSYTEENFPVEGVFIKESESCLQTYSLDFKELKEFKTKFDLSFRKKKYTPHFTGKGFSNNETILIRSQSQINLFNRMLDGNLYYQATTERAARLEKVFIRVPKGTGSYLYLGDLNENGIAEENEFKPDPYEGDFIQRIIPTDELFPVIDLKLNSRWKVDFKKYFKKKNLLNNILKSLTSVTTFRVEENSKEQDTEKIYLLHFSNFLNDSTTIRGSNYFQQDLHIFKNRRELSFRLRFTQRKSLNQFSAGLEKSFLKEKSLRIKFKMIKEINNETEIINRIENVLAPVTTNRSRLTTANIVKSDFSYRPSSFWEVGFSFKVGRLEDKYPPKPTIIDENRIGLRFTLSLLRKGRLRMEIERTELVANTTENIIPFEITNGNLLGKNYIWRTNFDYRFSGNLQANINYSGRLHGKGKVINTLRAEARAYF